MLSVGSQHDWQERVETCALCSKLFMYGLAALQLVKWDVVEDVTTTETFQVFAKADIVTFQYKLSLNHVYTFKLSSF